MALRRHPCLTRTARTTFGSVALPSSNIALQANRIAWVEQLVTTSAAARLPGQTRLWDNAGRANVRFRSLRTATENPAMFQALSQAQSHCTQQYYLFLRKRNDNGAPTNEPSRGLAIEKRHADYGKPGGREVTEITRFVMITFS